MNFPGLTQHNTGSFFLIGLMAALSVVFGSRV